MTQEAMRQTQSRRGGKEGVIKKERKEEEEEEERENPWRLNRCTLTAAHPLHVTMFPLSVGLYVRVLSSHGLMRRICEWMQQYFIH